MGSRPSGTLVRGRRPSRFDVRKPAEKKATKTVKPPPKGAAGRHAKHATGPQSVGVKAQLTPLTSNVGQYLVAKAAPVLARGVSKIGNLSLHQQTHDNADRKVHQAKKAVVIPESDGQSKSNFSQVGVVAAKPPPEPDENKAKDELTQSLAQNVPKSIEDVDNFKRDMKAQHTGADVLKVVQTDKNAVVSTFGDMEHTPPPLPPEHAPEELPPPEAAPPTGTMNLGQGAVAPLLPEHTDVSQITPRKLMTGSRRRGCLKSSSTWSTAATLPMPTRKRRAWRRPRRPNRRRCRISRRMPPRRSIAICIRRSRRSVARWRPTANRETDVPGASAGGFGARLVDLDGDVAVQQDADPGHRAEEVPGGDDPVAVLGDLHCQSFRPHQHVHSLVAADGFGRALTR